jgi:hypothetical protein
MPPDEQTRVVTGAIVQAVRPGIYGTKKQVIRIRPGTVRVELLAADHRYLGELGDIDARACGHASLADFQRAWEVRMRQAGKPDAVVTVVRFRYASQDESQTEGVRKMSSFEWTEEQAKTARATWRNDCTQHGIAPEWTG